MVATDEKRQAGFALRVAPEDQAAYDRRIPDAVEWYQPESPAMHDLVLRIVNANWLLQSLQNYASAAMCKGMPEGTRLADGFSDIARFEAIARYEGTLNRTLDNARRTLEELRNEIREEKITKRTPCSTSHEPRALLPHRQSETRTKPELKKRTNKLVGPAPPTAGSPI